MNRHARRCAAHDRKPLDRAEVIRIAMKALAAAGPTATGATLLLPSGEVLRLDAEAARALHSTRKNGGRT